MKTCIHIDPGPANTPRSGIKLEQEAGSQKFKVTYGLQVRSKLSYLQAAKELGQCIMHSLACDGLLDNGGP